jgi:hypothetical protein
MVYISAISLLYVEHTNKALFWFVYLLLNAHFSIYVLYTVEQTNEL